MNEINPTNQKHTSAIEQKFVFFFVCMGVIALTYGFLYLIDFLPEKTDTVNTEVVENTHKSSNDTQAQTASVSVDAQQPLAIIFDSLKREVPILNPQTSSVEALDAALLSGVVRHPDSADFSKKGTIFLLGHSSYLPVVHNKNFQAFNDIQKLVFGDIIRLRSKDTEYVYSVDRVYQAKASDARVDIQYDVAKLTLATCNSFGTKDDRYIVEATLVKSFPLSS